MAGRASPDAERERTTDDAKYEFIEARNRIAERLGVSIRGTKQFDDADIRAIKNLFDEILGQLEAAVARISELEDAAEPEEPSAEELALDRLRRAAAARAAVAEKAVRALTSLLPQAKAQARKGKPALLRMILRASR